MLASLPLLLLVLPSISAGARGPQNPISRVTGLLENLAAQVEKEAAEEEKLFETFVCWGKGVISAKTASNAAAESRITSQTQYIADIEAGRIEFTSERQDLEKDLAQVNADIELATEMRAKENSDFESAKDEMGKAIAALDGATEVLATATENHKSGTLLALRGAHKRNLLSAAESLQAGVALAHAADLGDRFLSKGDAVFLRRMLTGEVPTADWKKLNRKATFKMSYKARSSKIQDVLANLLSTFESNLDEATKKEAAAVKTFDSLMETKHEQKSASEDALAKMEQENGARGMSKEDAQAEVDALTKQVADDTKYIAQVTQTLATKKQEWKDRQTLRAGELAAVSKAISILHSDDARDLMKRSFKSQAYSLLQSSSTTLARRGVAAAVTLRAAARGDQRLSALAAQLNAGPSHFAEVIAAVDSMISTLNAEENTDLEKKETCETNRAADSRKAAKLSREVDEMSDTISRLSSEIAELEAQIASNQQQVKEIEAELAEATRIREAENAAYVVSKKDDEDAASVVANARSVLETFYKENSLMLVQHKQQPGEAPPPPPATWEAPYGGKVNEANGILEVLSMVVDDINKDLAKADAEEAAAQSAFDAVKADLEQSKADLEASIVEMNGQVAAKGSDIETMKGDKRTSKGELKALLEAMADAAPGCDFFMVNYEVRRTNRHTEIDGLNKAKAILEGAAFTKNTDATREIKPGDALLQRHRITKH